MRFEAFSIMTSEGPHTVTGYPVWGTNRLMAVDSRDTAGTEWHITHTPTGLRIAICFTRQEADAVARSFLRACTIRGWNVGSSDPEAIQAAFRALTMEEQRAFRRDAGLDS